MPTLTYSNSAFVTLTRISSSVMNQYFTDITTWANTTKLDYLNLQTAGVRALNISSQSALAGQMLVADGAGAATFSSIGSSALFNLSLTATIGSSLLTVALRTAAGVNATSSTPIGISFRNSTITTGTYNDRSVTAALSINTVATGCTFGLTSAVNQYIYVYAIDNAGTVELALAGSSGFDEGTVYSTTVINGSSTSSTTLYSTTARTSVPIRLIGRLKSNQTTSGTYASAISEISLAPFKKYLAPTVQKFTSSTGTYTTPADAIYIRVRMVGGGGGGGGGGSGAGTNGGNGGNTTFGTTLLVANGGVGGTAINGAVGTGGTASLGTGPVGTALTGGNGSSTGANSGATDYIAGGMGGNSFFGGAGGCRAGVAGENGVTNTGGGGGGGSGGNAALTASGSGGGAGGFVEAIISIPLSSYAYAVGAAGASGNAGTNGFAGGTGGSGYIEVLEFYQ